MPHHFKYIFLEEESTKSAIISNSLIEREEEECGKILKEIQDALGWNIFELKGIIMLRVCTNSRWKKSINQSYYLRDD